MSWTRPINRRSFVANVAGGLAVAGGAFGLLQARARADPPGASHPPSPQDSDRDPDDPSGQGRLQRGRDHGDPVSRAPRAGSVLSRLRTRCSDRDPSDRTGHGRHCVSPFIARGSSDRDPTDRPSSGRGR